MRRIAISHIQYMNNGWLLVSTINVGQLWKNIGIALLSVLLTFGNRASGVSGNNETCRQSYGKTDKEASG